MPTPDPTPCRFVLYCFESSKNGLPIIVERPALVTSVHEDGAPNLFVFFEPEESDRHRRPPYGFSGNNPYYREVLEGSEPTRPIVNTWRWPPRV